MDKFEDPNTIYRPADVMNDVRREFSIQMSYQKARRCREAALECLRGSPEDSYAKLPAYAHNLVLSNPGTVYYLETDCESCFKYFFLSFGPCIRGFHSSMRPVVVVDGTFLTVKYKGTLIVATCQDTNMQIYPLAWGIVDSENDASWYWFFTNLKEITGDREDLVIISDRNRSLINAVRDVYQNTRHDHCIYHIKGNLRTATRKADTISLFMKVAEAYTIEEFENFMGQIQSTDTAGWSYLRDTNFETWARSHFQGNRNNIMTSNNAESLNSVFRKDRRGSILALIERIGNKLQKYFHERRQNAQNCTSHLTPNMEENLRKSHDKAKRFTAQPVDQMRYVLRNGTMTFIVNFEESTCTCRKFQLDHFPCEHAIAAAKQRGYSVYLLCSDYYTVDFWRAAYAEIILPAPNKIEWKVLEQIKEINVLPPSVRQQVGRRRTKRVPSTGEFAKRNKCSRCGRKWHNRLTCPNQTPMVDRQSQD